MRMFIFKYKWNLIKLQLAFNYTTESEKKNVDTVIFI